MNQRSVGQRAEAVTNESIADTFENRDLIDCFFYAHTSAVNSERNLSPLPGDVFTLLTSLSSHLIFSTSRLLNLTSQTPHNTLRISLREKRLNPKTTQLVTIHTAENSICTVVIKQKIPS